MKMEDEQEEREAQATRKEASDQGPRREGGQRVGERRDNQGPGGESG